MFDNPFRVTIKMLSDWHIGTGAGIPGSTDALLSKDADGFPQIPAKTLNGIWRDALERLTLALDDGKESEWSKIVNVIFGNQPSRTKSDEIAEKVKRNELTPNQSLLKLKPARISAKLRDKILATKDLKLKQALTFMKVGVAIDGDSGNSKPECLRFVEMGRIGTILETECELDLNGLSDNEKKCVESLLILSTKFIERIGGKRRRGAGKCEFTIDKADFDDAKKWLCEHITAPTISFVKNPRESFDLIKKENQNEWQSVEYKLTLETPVSIATATLGNVTETLDFVPGTYLLPHLTKVFGKGIFQAVAYGDIQISPATIEIKENVGGEVTLKRGFPVPKVLAQDKLGGGFDKAKTNYNRFEEQAEPKNGNHNSPQIKTLRSGFVSDLFTSGQLPNYEVTPQSVLMHNVIEDKLQRPTEDVVGIFSRETISAGTTLRGEIRWRNGAIDKDKLTELTKNVRIGTSKKDDYGLAKFEIIGTTAQSFAPKSALNEKKLVVYFQSDVLLRNKQLRQTNSIDDLAESLSEKLGVELTEIKPPEKMLSSLVQVRRVESWQQSWGFPRPTLTAMQAGSCVLFEADKEPDLAKLQQIEAQGIGERRGEGYGQIVFNPKILIGAINGWSVAQKPDDKPNNEPNSFPFQEDEAKFVRIVEESAWREELKRAVLQIADDEGKRKEIFGFESKDKPPMSQIGGLRSMISRLRQESDKQLVEDWLDHLKATKNRLERWDKNESEAKNKIDRIKNLIADPNKVWEHLTFNQPKVLHRSHEDLQKEFWAEAVRSLFDACARAHKRTAEKDENPNDGKEIEKNGAGD